MRIVGLAGFGDAAILLSVLVLRWHGRLAAIVVLSLFEFSPFGLAWGAAALVDFPGVALSIGVVVGLDAWFRTGSRIGLLLGAMSGWLAFLVKATGFLAGPIPGVAAGLSWARYADAGKEPQSANPILDQLTPR
jgi:hypothetical protein